MAWRLLEWLRGQPGSAGGGETPRDVCQLSDENYCTLIRLFGQLGASHRAPNQHIGLGALFELVC